MAEGRLEALWRRLAGVGDCGKMLEHKRRQLDACVRGRTAQDCSLFRRVCAELVDGIRAIEGEEGKAVEESNDLLFASSMLELLEGRNFVWRRGRGRGKDKPGVVRDEEWRCATLEFLVGEYQTAMLLEASRQRSTVGNESDEMKEQEEMKRGLMKLRRWLKKLKQPHASKASELFRNLRAAALKTTREAESGEAGAGINPSAFELSEKFVQDHLNTLRDISQEFHSEFRLRREMLVTRMKATAHCFQLSQTKIDQAVTSQLNDIENLEKVCKFYKPEVRHRRRDLTESPHET
eukprot:763908-Hanusia_phi.AAC.10